MKKILIGLMVLLVLGVVGCSGGESTTNDKNLILTETEVSQIIDSRESTGDEYNATIKYLANQMKDAQEEYVELIEKNESKEDIFTAMNEYRDKLMDIEKSIEKFMLFVSITDIENNEQLEKQKDKYLLKELKEHYSNSLTYEIDYIRDQDSNKLDEAKEELKKALQKYEEISNL